MAKSFMISDYVFIYQSSPGQSPLIKAMAWNSINEIMTNIQSTLTGKIQSGNWQPRRKPMNDPISSSRVIECAASPEKSTSKIFLLSSKRFQMVSMKQGNMKTELDGHQRSSFNKADNFQCTQVRFISMQFIIFLQKTERVP